MGNGADRMLLLDLGRDPARVAVADIPGITCSVS